MKKLKLDFDDLKVESFQTPDVPPGVHGTVKGYDVSDSCGGTCFVMCTGQQSCAGTCVPVCVTNQSCDGTCFEQHCTNNTDCGQNTCDWSCDTGCGGGGTDDTLGCTCL
jgi:hypothetical protein